jgi:hypothetical protein
MFRTDEGRFTRHVAELNDELMRWFVGDAPRVHPRSNYVGVRPAVRIWGEQELPGKLEGNIEVADLYGTLKCDLSVNR